MSRRKGAHVAVPSAMSSLGIKFLCARALDPRPGTVPALEAFMQSAQVGCCRPAELFVCRLPEALDARARACAGRLEVGAVPVGDQLQPGEGEGGDAQGLHVQQRLRDDGQAGDALLLVPRPRGELLDAAQQHAVERPAAEVQRTRLRAALQGVRPDAQGARQQRGPSAVCCTGTRGFSRLLGTSRPLLEPFRSSLLSPKAGCLPGTWAAADTVCRRLLEGQAAEASRSTLCSLQHGRWPVCSRLRAGHRDAGTVGAHLRPACTAAAQPRPPR